MHGQGINSDSLFSFKDLATVTVEDITGRRNVVMQAINQKLNDPKFINKKEEINTKKAKILADEKKMESNYKEEKRKQKLNKSKGQYFWTKVNKKFLAALATTDTSIAGCYAPNGDHAEKIVEDGLKANTAILSLYEEKRSKDKESPEIGNEIENIEVIFTDQGMFCYKIYTNGHQKDTSLVWLQLFKELLAQQVVPAIILPFNFPSPRVFSLISHYITPTIYSSVITYRDDFFAEEFGDSYYDFKPEKIKQGDILLTSENYHLLDASNSPGNTTLLSSNGLEDFNKEKKTPQISTIRMKKDLGGAITQDVMRKLKKDHVFEPHKDTLNVFGRFIAQYVSEFVEKGEENPNVLAVGFDVDQWNRRKSKTSSKITNEEKLKLINRILAVINEQILSYYEGDVGDLYNLDKQIFFELKEQMEKFVAKKQEQHPLYMKAKQQLYNMNHFLRQRVEVLEINSAPVEFQNDVMRWIFRNEDRVWRDRGGRPGA